MTDTDAIGRTTSTAKSVSVGTSTKGTIDNFFDKDWFKVYLSAGKTYKIDLEGLSTNKGTLSNPEIFKIYDGRGYSMPNTYDNDSGVGYNASLLVKVNLGGYYYISATGNISNLTNTQITAQTGNSGTYTLTVKETASVATLNLDTIGETTSTAKSISSNSTTTGTIDSTSDNDWFKVYLSKGTVYTINLEGSPTNKGTLSDPDIGGIYNSTGKYISSSYDYDSGTGYNAKKIFTVDVSAYYYIEASGFRSETGSYELSIKQTGGVGFDVGNTVSTSQAMSIGSSVSGTINATNDYDWYKVYMYAGKTYQIDIEGSATSGGTLTNPFLRGIYDASGKYIIGSYDNNSGIGYNAKEEFTAKTSGYYYISADGYSTSTGTYKLNVKQIATDTVGNTIATSKAMKAGSTVNGRIDATNDYDWYKVYMKTGESYQVDLMGTATKDGTLTNPLLRGIYDSKGKYIPGSYDHDSGSGSNAKEIFTAKSNGYYYLAADGYGSSLGTYKLSVKQVTLDIIGDTAKTAKWMATGTSITGKIDAVKDYDWYKVYMHTGRTYNIDIEGIDTNQGTLSNPFLRGVYNSSGKYTSGSYDNNSGTGENAKESFTPTTSGYYYIGADGYSTSIGTYKLSVSLDVGDTTKTAKWMAAGTSIKGSIDAIKDYDWYKVYMYSGNRYQIDVEGSSTSKGTLSDPFFRGVYDSSGKYIPTTYDNNSGVGKNTKEIFTPKATGYYYVAADGYSTSVGTYTLSVSVDIGQTKTTAKSIGVNGGTATSIIDLATDKDWFKVYLYAGRMYQIDLEGSSTSKGTLTNPYLNGIYDASGKYISGSYDVNSGTGYNSQEIFTPKTTGMYYVSADGYFSTNIGTYTLTVKAIKDTVGQTFSTAKQLIDQGGLSGTTTSAIESYSDKDWFKVYLYSGRTYQIDIEGTPTKEGTLSNPYLNGIYNSFGQYINGTADNNSGTGNNASESFKPIESGYYYISADGYGTSTGTYKVNVKVTKTDSDFGIKLPPISISEILNATKLNLNTHVKDTISSTADTDIFAVTLDASKTYTVDLAGSSTNEGTLSNPAIAGIFNSSGVYQSESIDFNSGTGTNAELKWSPATSGTYYIQASGFASVGSYDLSISDGSSLFFV